MSDEWGEMPDRRNCPLCGDRLDVVGPQDVAPGSEPRVQVRCFMVLDTLAPHYIGSLPASVMRR